MLNCKISKKFTTSCETNVAGIDKIAVANWNPNYVFTSSNSGCSIDSIDLKDEKVYDMPFMDGTGYFNITGTIGANRDSKYYLHTVGFVLPNLSCENLEDLTNYFLAKVIAFVRTKNGKVYAIGVDSGISASTFEIGSGTAEGDQSGLNVVYDGAQKNPMLELTDWALVEALIEK